MAALCGLLAMLIGGAILAPTALALDVFVMWP
jgi:hypothetical protein